MSTLDYYNQNAAEYYSGTVEADVSELYSRFEPLLPEHAKIVDIGCGMTMAKVKTKGLQFQKLDMNVVLSIA